MVRVKPDAVTEIANSIGAAVDGTNNDGGLTGIISLLNSGNDFQASFVGTDFAGDYGRTFVTGFDNIVAMLRQWSAAAEASSTMLQQNMQIVLGVDQKTKDDLENSVAGW